MKILPLLMVLCTLVFASALPDNCMTCHKNTTPIDKYHPYSRFGCASCHGGDKNARTEAKAHKGMVLNPARLENAQKHCALCHQDVINRVHHSIMNNMHGVLDVLRYQFHETKNIEHTTGIDFLKSMPTPMQSLAEDHFSKMCAACHINQKENIFKNGFTPRGGGCVDCHKVQNAKFLGVSDGHLKLRHPVLSTRIPSKNCLKCHNRSNRIGLAYFGKFESEGYGTPYHNGKLTHKIDHGRYYYNLPADIHHTMAKLDCIDCHTQTGVMGNGKYYAHMEGAEDIKCKDCHSPKFEPTSKSYLASMLIVLNGKVPYPQKVAVTSKFHTPIYNLQKENGKITFYRKRDGKAFPMMVMNKAPYHTEAIHKKLACSACHSKWIPSCYGCHEVYFKDAKQYDWIKHKQTKGRWMELRSYLRYESPTLAIGYNKKIMPAAPGCQVITTIYGKHTVTHAFHSFAYAAWDPHTVQKGSRTCIDCHFNPRTLGLGAGILNLKDNKITFTPFYNSKKSGLPISYPIDALISPKGKQYQSFSRKNARGFDKKELYKIVEAYKCIICHDHWSDPIYKNFAKSKKRFYEKKTVCYKMIFEHGKVK
jgi:hypothetical protein